MKRKPSAVSVILFIIMFVVFYFLEQRLHIFANTINTSAGPELETMQLGKAETDFITSSIRSIFKTNIIY